MNTNTIEAAFNAFDTANANDMNTEIIDGTETPKELIYGKRMSEMLLDFEPEASVALQLAARCQHICRWEIPRKNYEMNRKGYLTWRSDLKKFHAQKATEILTQLNFDTKIIERVAFLLQKKQLKRDQETQVLEDVVCLVFLNYYYEPFRVKHTNEKVIDIVQKTWKKMSEKGHEAALKLSYSNEGLALIQQALQ